MFLDRNLLEEATPIYMGNRVVAPKDWCFNDVLFLCILYAIRFLNKIVIGVVKLVLEILRKACYNVSQVTWLYRMGAN